MREILFRGKWLSHPNEWVYGYLIKTRDICLIADVVIGIEEVIQVVPETAGQYTGMKDITGNKIFEGDIVECEKMGNKYKTVMHVVNVNLLHQ